MPMEFPMLRRFQKIASIPCRVLCLAFMGMWIRSYHITDFFWVPLPGGYKFGGSLFPGRPTFHFVSPEVGLDHQFHWRSEPVAEDEEDEAEEEPIESSSFLMGIGFYYNDWPSADDLTLPYYFLVLASASLALLLRMRWPWRFTLRQLFIVTTFLVFVLGMIACLDRSWIFT
jgi:hypothetical protein